MTTPNNKSKIKTTVKQFFREWCSESVEKEDYIRLVRKCQQYLKPKDVILVPGCGLGRLVFELIRAGFGA
jgi:carnosine N-methyltransferase